MNQIAIILPIYANNDIIYVIIYRHNDLYASS